MGMDKLKAGEFFPTAKEDEELSEYSAKLLKWAEKDLWYKIAKRINFLLGLLEKGTTQGQMLFWDATLEMWVPPETSELIWDDVNKRIGINDSSPQSRLDVKGTVMVTRLLAGGVGP